MPGLIGRAIVLLPASMALWWFLLKPGSLWLLRALAYLPLGLLVAPPGLDPVKLNPDTHEWVFNVAVNAVAKNPLTGQRQFIDSMEFAVDEKSVAFFAGGWFAYLGLALSAAGFSGRQARRLLQGVVMQTALNILCLGGYVYINGRANVAGSSPWLLQYCYYLIDGVVPYAGPFVVALTVHPEWRGYFRTVLQESARPGRIARAGRSRAASGRGSQG